MIHNSDGIIKEYTYTDFSASFGDGEKGAPATQPEEDLPAVAAMDESAYEGNMQSQAGAGPLQNEPEEDTAAEVTDITAVSDEQVALLIEDAKEQAASIIREAMATAERVKKDAFVEAGAAASEAQQTGYNDGFEKGRKAGYEKALEESRRELEEQNRSLLEEISHAIAELDRQKTDYIRMYNEEMKDLVITIAEKVIGVSLKSSGEIIRRMILNAVENSHEKQWAKVFLSEYDANIMVHEDSDILDALRKVSENIKIEVMENGEQGDLLIEYPDQVVDAGVRTQLGNIRRIMDDVS